MTEQQLSRLLHWLDRRLHDVNFDKTFQVAYGVEPLYLDGEYTAYNDVLGKIEELISE